MEYGLIGQATRYTFAKHAHSLLGDYEYTLKDLPPHELGGFLRAGGFRGVNIAEPYKVAALPYCDDLAAVARQIGCVNVAVRGPDGALVGHNTDYPAMLYAIGRLGVRVGGKKVLILGDSGVGRAAKLAVSYLGARDIVQISKTGQTSFAQLKDHVDAQIIIQATEVGMYPNNCRSLVNLELFTQCEGVVETIYNPVRSSLMLAARDRGIPAVNPVCLMAARAKYSSELFTGRMMADERIRSITRKIKREISNIVLVGMPGSGKTAVGKYLSQKLGRGFLDVDTVIEQRSGASVGRIIEREGEAAYRDLEAKTIANIGKQTGKVIATGSGAVLAECNYSALKQNGVIVFLTRPAPKIAAGGKAAVGQRQRSEQMYAQRLPRYLYFADCTIENTETIQQTGEKIFEAFLNHVDNS